MDDYYELLGVDADAPVDDIRSAYRDKKAAVDTSAGDDAKSDVAKLNTYDYDPAKAEELMTKAGYKKGADGVWAGPNGPLEFELTAPAEFADWSAAAENLATQLTDFGIKTTFRGVQFQQHTEDVQQGKFVIAIRGWGDRKSVV